jgi:hypothetical protein
MTRLVGGWFACTAAIMGGGLPHRMFARAGQPPLDGRQFRAIFSADAIST